MNGVTSKRTVDSPPEGESSAKRMNVTMEVDTLDCPICFEPLRPPIFQCSVGHLICSSCRRKQLDKKCPSCSVQTSFKRCFGVEHIVQAVIVPCSNIKYGCVEKVPYYQKEEHEKACENAPCFCPESGCDFAGPAMMLLDHLNTQHNFQSTPLTYSKTVRLWVQPGLRVLECSDVSHFFLLSVTSEPFGHAISLICAEPTATVSRFRCSMDYDNFKSVYSESSSCEVRSFSLLDGLPTGHDFILPKGKVYDHPDGIELRITICEYVQ